jgi:hypothetical protein
VFVVPMAAAKPLPPELQKPVAKAKAKPKAEAPAPVANAPKPDDAPIGFAKDEDDEDEEDAARPKPLGVIKEDDAPRCPHCAKELDPPDTKVCLECGYDLVRRRRHESKKVYEHTQQDYFIWWLPAIAWILVMGVVLGIEIWCILKMRPFIENNLDFLVKDDKNEVTKEAQYYLHPDCFTTCFSVITLAVMLFGIKFCIKRLYFNWRPPEVEKKSS